jgi:hypothetical protein
MVCDPIPYLLRHCNIGPSFVILKMLNLDNNHTITERAFIAHRVGTSLFFAWIYSNFDSAPAGKRLHTFAVAVFGGIRMLLSWSKICSLRTIIFAELAVLKDTR